jgi:hypothetical protein
VIDDLNEEFAAYLQRLLREDPELAEELRETGELDSWVTDKVHAQTDDDGIAPPVRRFVNAHLKAATVTRLIRAATKGRKRRA